MPQQMPFHIRQRIMPILQHEVGHFVSARVLGFRTDGISLTFDLRTYAHRAGNTIILSEPLGSLDAAKNYLSRRAQVLYAGVLAETLIPNGPTEETDQARACELLKPEAGAEQDYAKAREVIHLLRNVTHGDKRPESDNEANAQLKALNDEVWGKAVAIVEGHAQPIVRIAYWLLDKLNMQRLRIEVVDAELDSNPLVSKLTPRS
jgi:hypothetical protein